MFQRTVRCPYCHAQLDLARCPVVAKPPGAADAARLSNASHSSPDGTWAYDEDIEEESREPQEVRKRWYELGEDRDQALDRYRGRSGGIGGQRNLDTNTPLLHSRAPRETSPAFVCSECRRVLPEDIEARTAATIGVLGTTGSGKTHFLGVTLGQAKSDQALAPFGIKRFQASVHTDKSFHQDYWVPIHLDREAYGPTTESDISQKIKDPLSFSATIHEKPWRFLFYDLPGESLMDPTTRRTELSFLHRADAFIFLIDPLGFASVRDGVTVTFPERMIRVAKLHSQTELLTAMAEELGDKRASEVPVAIAITKSDLIFDAFGRIDDRLHAEELQVGRAPQIEELSEVIEKKVLPLLESPELEMAVNGFRQRSLHLIASIGSNPVAGPGDGDPITIPKFKPSRGIDPLLAVLHRIRI